MLELFQAVQYIGHITPGCTLIRPEFEDDSICLDSVAPTSLPQGLSYSPYSLFEPAFSLRQLSWS